MIVQGAGQDAKTHHTLKPVRRYAVSEVWQGRIPPSVLGRADQVID
jgi:hypothetical protein